MSTITALTSTDTGATSLTTINTNFTNLNTDKYQSGSTPTFGNTTITTSGFGYLNIGRRTDASTVSALLAFDSSAAGGLWVIQNNAGLMKFYIGGTLGSSNGTEKINFDVNGDIRTAAGSTLDIGSLTATTSCIATFTSTTGAVLLPRMTGTQRDALTGAAGMIIYNTTTNKLNVRVAAGWEAVTSA